MEQHELAAILESLLFITDTPLSEKSLRALTGASAPDISAGIQELSRLLDERRSALMIREVAEGYQMATRQEYSAWVRKLFLDKMTFRLTKSALETLAIIAYKQPITRAEIEQIRGVDAAGVLENLLQKKLIRLCGRKDAAGRPMLYGTTSEFLKFFGLRTLADMPSLEEFVQAADVGAEEPRKDQAAQSDASAEVSAAFENATEPTPVSAETADGIENN